MADPIVEEIRARVDLVELVSDYVALTQAGNRWKGLCPFHQEKTPSFTVNPQMGFFKCFGCGASGDAFKFLMQMESLTFPEALKRLAERAGVTLPTSRFNPQRSSEKEKFFDANRLAAQFFQEQLLKSPQAQHARDYLKKRGISDAIRQKFGLGYAPDAWDGLLIYLRRNRVQPAEAAAVGLVIQRGDKSGYYDRFRNRLMVPICDTQGQIIAFGGRTLGNDDAKYINSPESPLFNKSRVLFGLHLARNYIGKRDEIIVVEGYMDLIALHQFGFENAVATMGTAVTEHHARMMARYTKNVVIAFDADSAGMNAALRSVPLFAQHELRVRVLICPAGDDPDSYVRRVGTDEFRAAIDAAMPLVEYRLRRATADLNMNNEQQRLEMIRRVVPILMSVRSGAERAEYVRKLGDHWAQDDPSRSLMAQQAIEMELRAARRRMTGSAGASPSRRPGVEQEYVKEALAQQVVAQESGIVKIERELLALMLQDRRAARQILEQMKPGDFIDEHDQHIAVAIADSLREVEPANIHDLLAWLPEGTATIAEGLAVSDVSFAQAKGAIEERILSIRAYRENRSWTVDEMKRRAIEKLQKGEPLNPEETAILTESIGGPPAITRYRELSKRST
jgi:DNA primase